MDIKEKVYGLLKEIIVNTEKIGSDDQLIKYGMDSIKFIKLFVSIETEFDIEFDDDDLGNTDGTTVNSLVEYIKVRLHNKG